MNTEQRTVGLIVTILGIMVAACIGIVWIGVSLIRTGEPPTFASSPTATPTVDVTNSSEGVVITAVFPESPASSSGLLPGFIIVEANGQPIGNTDELQLLVENVRPGGDVNLYVLVDGELRQTTAVRGETPPYLGIEIVNRADFTPSDIATPIPPVVSTPDASLTVAAVLPNSPAEQIGMQVGDVITAVDNVPMQTQADLVAAIGSKQPRVVIALTFQRGTDTLIRSVTLASNPDNPEQGFLGVELGNGN